MPKDELSKEKGKYRPKCKCGWEDEVAYANRDEANIALNLHKIACKKS